MGLVPTSALSKRLNPKIGQYVLLIDHSCDGDVANVFGQVIPRPVDRTDGEDAEFWYRCINYSRNQSFYVAPGLFRVRRIISKSEMNRLMLLEAL